MHAFNEVGKEFREKNLLKSSSKKKSSNHSSIPTSHSVHQKKRDDLYNKFKLQKQHQYQKKR